MTKKKTDGERERSWISVKVRNAVIQTISQSEYDLALIKVHWAIEQYCIKW